MGGKGTGERDGLLTPDLREGEGADGRLERGRGCRWEKVRAGKAIIVSAPSSLPLRQASGTQAA